MASLSLAYGTHHVKCSNPTCGFRVNEEYFAMKVKRFSPGWCPTCNNPVEIVGRNDNVVDSTKRMDPETGRIVNN